MKTLNKTKLVALFGLLAVVVALVGAGSAQAGGYGHGHGHVHYAKYHAPVVKTYHPHVHYSYYPTYHVAPTWHAPYYYAPAYTPGCYHGW